MQALSAATMTSQMKDVPHVAIVGELEGAVGSHGASRGVFGWWVGSGCAVHVGRMGWGRVRWGGARCGWGGKELHEECCNDGWGWGLGGLG